MGLVLADRVQEITTTTGTGTINLGGSTVAYQGFINGIGSGNKVSYVIASGDGLNWECGIGTVTAGSPNTLSRDIVTASSNGGAAINLNGTSTVWCDATSMVLGIDFEIVTASEAIFAGAIVSLWSNSGVLNVQKANATDTTEPADAFAPLAIGNGAAGIVVFNGVNTAISGLTPGVRQYLSLTDGIVTATPPSSVGNIIQSVGVALSATRLMFRPAPGVKL
jgi:hypothetical protein